jgi:hypothetical protein
MMRYLSPDFLEVSPLQGLDYKRKRISVSIFITFYNFELKLRDTYLKISLFTPKKVSKCLQISDLRDTWRHLRDTLSSHTLAWCLQKYGENRNLETLTPETLMIKALYMRFYMCFCFQISVSKYLQLSLVSVSQVSLSVSDQEVSSCQY